MCKRTNEFNKQPFESLCVPFGLIGSVASHKGPVLNNEPLDFLRLPNLDCILNAALTRHPGEMPGLPDYHKRHAGTHMQSLFFLVDGSVVGKSVLQLVGMQESPAGIRE